MTIVTTGDDTVLEQIEKQLNKLVDVLKVTDLTGSQFVGRELMLLKVRTTRADRGEVVQLVDVFKANIVNVQEGSLIIEVTGPSEKIDAFIDLMTPFGIIELGRTGKVALARSSQTTEMLEPPAPFPEPSSAAVADVTEP
jgi:acetolactate synthase I/III small subunit